MARRHLLLSQKIIGDEAVLHPATLEALEMSPEGGQILVTCSATYLVLKAVGKESVSEHQIKLPRRAAAVLKEGERLTVQPAPLVQDTARSNGHAPRRRRREALRERIPRTAPPRRERRAAVSRPRVSSGTRSPRPISRGSPASAASRTASSRPSSI